MARFLGWFISIILIVALAAAGLIVWYQFESQAPQIKPVEIPGAMGIKSRISVDISENRTGLRVVRAEIVQNGKTVPLQEKRYPVHPFWERRGVIKDSILWDIEPAKLGLSDGNAVVRIIAADLSWSNGFRGNEAVLEIKLPVDITPPRIAVRSTVHNIRMGGAGLVSYDLNEIPAGTGVRVGKTFFPAYKFSHGSQIGYIALVALPYDAGDPGRIIIEAEDNAGNRSKASVAYTVLKRRSKVDRINITDSFLQRKVPDLVIHYPDIKGSLIEQFLVINNKIRTENNAQLSSLCRNGEPTMMWHGSFIRMPGALRARFADYRHYMYKNREIDQAYHMGVDIADRSHSPVPAGNKGRVVFAGFLGIYGNTVVLDHGIGLFSTYSHLSQINVTRDDMVERGQTIGLTGLTGLAGGDHLHYGMMINGVFVNPVEWWDMKWIRDHILANLT